MMNQKSRAQMWREEQQKEVDANYAAFCKILPELMLSHAGKYALLHSRKVLAIFDTSNDAVRAAQLCLEDSHFSVQRISNKAARLGFRGLTLL